MLKQAKWIWLPGGSETKNLYVDFKSEFQGDAAELTLSAEGNYAVYCNDAFVDSGQYPDLPHYKIYETLNLTPFLRPEGNTLLIRVWRPGEDHFSYRAEQAGLLFAVYSGDRLLAASGPETLAARCPCFQNEGVPKLTAQLGFTFCYDATQTETYFAPAAVVEKQARLFPRPVPKLTVGERSPARIVSWGVFEERPWEVLGQRIQNAALSARYLGPETPTESFEDPAGDGLYLLIDLGQEEVGYLDLELTLPEDALILGGYGEHLTDLRVRAFVGKRNFAFTYQGTAGRNTFFMPFRRLGMRYLQLHIYTHSVRLHYAGLRPTTYPLGQPAGLPFEDRLHQRIYDTCLRTLRHCMHDHFEDTPWREQGLYTMDSRNEMLCCYAAFHETALPRESLRLIALSLREDGLVELCSPGRAGLTIPAFSAVFPLQLWEYYEASGDRKTAAELLPAAERVAAVLESRIDPKAGLLAAFEEKQYWNYYEWQKGLDGKATAPTYDAPLNAFVSMGFRALAQLCAVLGEEEKAARYEGLYRQLNVRMEQTFWNGKWYHSFCGVEDGKCFHDAQLTQALMLCCGAAPEEKASGLRELLKEKNGPLLPVTLSHSIFKYDALMTDPGNLSWMLEDIADIWGKMLFQGATTFWETAEGASDFHNAGSLCHGWSAVPLYLYHRYGKETV